MKLSDAIKILSEAGIDSARHDAKAIFSELGGISQASLMIGDAECGSESVSRAVMMRAERIPLQYILGKCAFYREEYFVNENCLIPRADTEILVDFAVRHIPECESFVDLCTGSGCVGISVLKNTVGTRGTLVDISDGALLLAKKNAEHNGVLERADIMRLDVMRDVPEGSFYAVLSNPPYVAESVYGELEREIFFEPKMAFVGGADGGDFYRHLTPIYKEKIKKGGFIAYEIGYDQADMLRGIAEECSMSCEIIRDLSGNDRVAVLRYKQSLLD